MKRLLCIIVMVAILAVPAQATEYTAPQAPREVQRYLPDETQDLGDGVWYVIRNIMKEIRPGLSEATSICISLLSISLLAAMLCNFASEQNAGLRLATTAVVAVILMRPANSMIQLGVSAVEEVSEYSKLLLPVMTSALAAQGAVTKSGALYTASAFVNALLSSGIEQFLVPLVYILLCVCIGCRLYEHTLLQNIRSFSIWLVTWGLKIVLYIFTGYVGITGVVSGATDAAMLKATKIAISGTVPVIGNILSDASEAVLVSVGLMKNAAGIYGILTILALCFGPFFQVGTQYLLLNVTSGVCHMFGIKETAELIKDAAVIMGLVMAMIGSICVITLISIVCFMKGLS